MNYKVQLQGTAKAELTKSFATWIEAVKYQKEIQALGLEGEIVFSKSSNDLHTLMNG